MAQVWQRLADEYADSTTMPPFSAVEQPQAPMQQQQQIQPEDDKKE